MASFTFNGLNSETDYDLRIHDVLYNVLPQTIDRDVKVPYGRGRYDYGTYLDANTIGFVCSLQGISYADVFTQVEAIAVWLNPELGVFELSYSGKPNRHCYAKISGNTSVKQILLYGKFTVIFKIPEGVWYGDEVNWTSNEATLEDEEVGSIFTTPSDMADAPMKADLSGMTVTQPINGGFAATTGWSPLHSTHAVSGGVYSLIGTGANTYPRTLHNHSTYTLNDKFYLKMRARVTNSDCLNLRVGLNTTGGILDTYLTQATPTINTWYTISGILTSSAGSGTTLVRMDNQYADAATANGKVMEVDYVYAINLNAHGLQAITDTAVLDAMFPHYIDGTVHAGATRFTSVGKNLYADGNISGAKSYSRILKHPLPVGTYTISAVVTSSDTDASTSLVFFMKADGVTMFNSALTRGARSSTTFTLPEPCARLVFYASDTAAHSAGDTFSFTDIQIELGSTATTYESYHDTHTTGTLPELRRLPNGVRDTYDLNTGVKVQRVSDGVAVVGVVSVDVTNYPLSLNGGSFINVLDAGGMETGTIGTDSTSADGILYYELATPVLTYVDPELENQDDEAVNFLLGGPSYTVNIDIDACPSPMTRYGTMEVIENNGGLSTEGVIEITCDFNTSFLEIKLDDSDEFIRIEDTFLVNDVIEINLNTGSVTKNGTSILDKVTLASTLFDGTFKIPRGTSLLSLHGASELTLVFEEKWL